MTLGDKTEREPGEVSRAPSIFRGSKAAKKQADLYNFSDVVDKACEGLMERKIKYSIRRIQEMEDILSGLEQELDAFLELRAADGS
ncbi:MAG: hypothetical protein FWD24_05095 [Treponema sp.]|nr:hypothetical protein [Treponema sp.]